MAETVKPVAPVAQAAPAVKTEAVAPASSSC